MGDPSAYTCTRASFEKFHAASWQKGSLANTATLELFCRNCSSKMSSLGIFPWHFSADRH